VILVYGLSNTRNCDDLECLTVIPLLQAFSNGILRISDTSRGTSASAELLVALVYGFH